MIRRHGIEIPIVDTRATFGFGNGGDAGRTAAGIVLEIGSEAMLAFNVDAVTDVMGFESVGRAVCVGRKGREISVVR